MAERDGDQLPGGQLLADEAPLQAHARQGESQKIVQSNVHLNALTT